MTPSTQTTESPVDEQRPTETAPLDALLVDAALGGLHRFLPGRAGVTFAAGLTPRADAPGTYVFDS